MLSAVFSFLLAIPVARALARRRFLAGGLDHSAWVRPLSLPVIVACLGLVGVFGRSRLVNMRCLIVLSLLSYLSGLHGVVLAHVFFNLPLATRLLLARVAEYPCRAVPPVCAAWNAAVRCCAVDRMPMLSQIAPGAFAWCL